MKTLVTFLVGLAAVLVLFGMFFFSGPASVMAAPGTPTACPVGYIPVYDSNGNLKSCFDGVNTPVAPVSRPTPAPTDEFGVLEACKGLQNGLMIQEIKEGERFADYAKRTIPADALMIFKKDVSPNTIAKALQIGTYVNISLQDPYALEENAPKFCTAPDEGWAGINCKLETAAQVKTAKAWVLKYSTTWGSVFGTSLKNYAWVEAVSAKFGGVRKEICEKGLVTPEPTEEGGDGDGGGS